VIWAKGAWWQGEYNTIRPHSSLDYKTPKEFRDESDRNLRRAALREKC
jgi:transposase InsO family protein